MTIKELKEQLNQFPDNARVFIPDEDRKGWYKSVKFDFCYHDYEKRLDGSSGLLYIS